MLFLLDKVGTKDISVCFPVWQYDTDENVGLGDMSYNHR